ncbi:diguanylate phosphodiesterase [Sphaerotilus sp.]|jgi:blue light- and temperature-responsive anti-repressor|uniref:diguanylate phosphodiesterase n=1 Tax=Sphaerotilus sp. TaxID=2093942 RepID=UPI0025DCBB21|nr:diguanylate phosphodiesterase [Sphaerotilus sp.]
MPALTHLIYSSAATRAFSNEDLATLLAHARTKNAMQGVTGMLLHVDGSFLQVLEGEPESVGAVFQTICADPRHTQIVTIIREPIQRRAFSDWSMGHPQVTPEELAEIDGANDFFTGGACLTRLNQGRAKKLLWAFKEGRWRSRLTGAQTSAARREPALPERPPISFAFAPVYDADQETVVSHEAHLCTQDGDPPDAVLAQCVTQQDRARLDLEARVLAIGLAARLGLTTGLTLGLAAHHPHQAAQALHSVLDTATQCGVAPERITIAVDQDRMTGDPLVLASIIQQYRAAGLKICLDHFGAGRSGLNQVESLQPDSIALNENLVRGIESSGPRQAIVRGILQTCDDLGIDVIAKHVATPAEYDWLRAEGITFFQGPLIGPALFEMLHHSLQRPAGTSA